MATKLDWCHDTWSATRLTFKGREIAKKVQHRTGCVCGEKVTAGPAPMRGACGFKLGLRHYVPDLRRRFDALERHEHTVV